MDPAPGDECHSDADGSDKDRCDDCGAQLEWTLDVDGVQRRVCPNCD